MDKSAYQEKMKALLADNTTYRKHKSEPTNARKNTIVAALAPIKDYAPDYTPKYTR